MRKTVALLAAALTTTVAAQVPVTKEPRHRVAFENADFRVIHVHVPPGAATGDHRHEFDVAEVSMSAGTSVREGSGGPRPSPPLGEVTISDHTGKPATHRTENVGKTPYQVFAVENLRQKGWSTGAPATGIGTTLASESRAFRVYDVRLGREAQNSSHTHAVPTVVVLIKGAVLSEGPDENAKSFAPAPVGLKQLTQTGEWLLVPAGDKHHIARLGTSDAHVVEIEVR